MISTTRLLFGAVLFFSLSGAQAAGRASEDVVITNSYVRVAQAQGTSAAYMTVTNRGTVAHTITSASGDAAQAIELHNHVEEGGMMRMRKIEGIEIPAGATVQLQPGGLHIMLIGLKQNLQDGASVHLDLSFEDGSKQMLMAPVKATPAMGPGHANPMHGNKHPMH